MPIISELKYRKPFKARVDLDQRLAEIVMVIAAIRTLEIHAVTKREMIDRALWLVAELSGNFSPRYRSDSALRMLGAKIQRDHVFPRSTLIALILEGKEPLRDIIDRAVCCLVTVEEHSRLSIAPPEVIGWERYRFADVIIRDMSTHKYIDEA